MKIVFISSITGPGVTFHLTSVRHCADFSLSYGPLRLTPFLTRARSNVPSVEDRRDPISETTAIPAVVVIRIYFLLPRVVGLPISLLCFPGVFSMAYYPQELCRLVSK